MIWPPRILGLPLYPLFVSLAVAVGAVVLCRGAGRGAGTRALPLLCAATLAGLAGAKLFSVVERGGAVWWDPVWELGNGYRYPGGLAAALAALSLLHRRWWPEIDSAQLGDVLAPGVAAAMFVVRVGCLLCGCCHGVPTGLPWALAFAAHSPPWRAHLERGWIDATATVSLPVHPLQIYFGLASGLILLVLVRLRRRAAAGVLLPSFLLLDGTAKLGLESLRLEYRAALQLAAAAQTLLALALLAWRVRTAPRRIDQLCIRS